ncbi:MAG: 4Fe-4S binding protein [Spirochaetia bacterium]
MPISVSQSRCPQNHPCPSVRICPANALKQNGFSAPIVDESKCTNCGKCIRFCPLGAIQG